MDNEYKKFLENPDQLRESMLNLYEEAPYPEVVAKDRPTGIPLLDHWINSAVSVDHPALHSASKILVAGCGSGEEAIVLARHYPNAYVVGIDFSERSIERANVLADVEKLTNIAFEAADLTENSWVGNYDPFDFVLCHGVADYVTDVKAMMQNLSACLSANGVLYMNVNSPYHPADRIRQAFSDLGVAPSSFNDTAEQRALLKMVVKLMGSNVGIDGLGEISKAILKIDIFPPIAHHLSIDEWCRIGEEAGLEFCGSMEALDALMQLDDSQLVPLYAMGKSKLSKWIIRLRKQAGMQMLFSPHKAEEPVFYEWEELLKWRPRLATFVGPLPELAAEPYLPMHLTLRFQGLPDFYIYTTAYDLEVFRRCNGSQSLEEILNAIPVPGNREALRASLFRAYHYGLLG